MVAPSAQRTRRPGRRGGPATARLAAVAAVVAVAVAVAAVLVPCHARRRDGAAAAHGDAQAGAWLSQPTGAASGGGQAPRAAAPKTAEGTAVGVPVGGAVALQWTSPSTGCGSVGCSAAISEPRRTALATWPRAQLLEPAADLAMAFRAAACALSGCVPQVLAADQQQVQGVSYQQAYQPGVLDDGQKAAALQQQRAYQEYVVFKKFQEFYEAQEELSRLQAADAGWAAPSRPAALQAPHTWPPAVQQPVPATSWPSGYQQLPTHATGVGAPMYYYPKTDDIPAGSYVPPGGIIINVQTSTPVNVENPISMDSSQKHSQASSFRRSFGFLH
eukprot:365366-Chlamydomonas_euryale.AAC.23